MSHLCCFQCLGTGPLNSRKDLTVNILPSSYNTLVFSKGSP